jgi:hypothetical protein
VPYWSCKASDQHCSTSSSNTVVAGNGKDVVVEAVAVVVADFVEVPYTYNLWY